MKSRAIAVIGIVVLLAGCSGLPVVGGPTVSNVDATVIDGTPTVVFDYDTDDYATAILEGPDGDALHERRLEPNENRSALWMRGLEPGEYRIVILQGGETATTRSVTFDGPDAELESFETEWSRNDLNSANMTIRNEGDMPMRVEATSLTVADRQFEPRTEQDLIAENESVTLALVGLESIAVREREPFRVEATVETSGGQLSQFESKNLATEELQFESFQPRWSGTTFESLEVGVYNNGSLPANVTISVLEGGDSVSDSSTVTIGGGEVETIDVSGFKNVFTAESGGTYEFNVIAESQTDQISRDYTKEFAESSISVDAISTEWDKNELRSIDATFANSGDFEGERIVTVSVNGEEIQEREVTVEPPTTTETLAEGLFGDPVFTAISGGDYETTVTVETPDGPVSRSSTTTFEGPDGEISNIDATFLSAGYDTDDVELSTVSFGVSNSGDMPLLYDEIRVSMGDESITESASGDVGTQFDANEYVHGDEGSVFSPGSYDLEVELLYGGDVVLSETTSVRAE